MQKHIKIDVNKEKVMNKIKVAKELIRLANEIVDKEIKAYSWFDKALNSVGIETQEFKKHKKELKLERELKNILKEIYDKIDIYHELEFEVELDLPRLRKTLPLDFKLSYKFKGFQKHGLEIENQIVSLPVFNGKIFINNNLIDNIFIAVEQDPNETKSIEELLKNKCNKIKSQLLKENLDKDINSDSVKFLINTKLEQNNNKEFPYKLVFEISPAEDSEIKFETFNCQTVFNPLNKSILKYEIMPEIKKVLKKELA